ncbi:helix-turn-helix domain-containing protein [Sphingobium sp. WTD-1]|uniref:helix-turn-helix domain-containing protein n=1 Tax=Sphingobium sp. WTD-1 TaxID=2979467 RepID=UPI0024DE0E7C|nr:helix-turn-helix domain-containing protein [Sphingobium sp. WTD-1]WIA57632.1 helix-turn-helix domain-containing protein [Sphingobium sp. WTD-1]
MATSPLTAERLSYSVTDAAHALGISERSIYNLIYGGKLRRMKIGRRVVIPAADLRSILEGTA